MADPRTDTDHPAALVCPWCSAAVTPETAVCPSCNAILISDEEHDLPGVTSVDEAAVRAERLAPQRSRFLSWLAGETPHTPSTGGGPPRDARTAVDGGRPPGDRPTRRGRPARDPPTGARGADLQPAGRGRLDPVRRAR